MQERAGARVFVSVLLIYNTDRASESRMLPPQEANYRRIDDSTGGVGNTLHDSVG